MFERSFAKTSIFILLTLTVSFAPAMADKQSEQATLQAALVLKLLPFYNNLEGRKFTIHVIGAPLVAEQLKTQLGRKFGAATLKDVTSGEGPPAGPVDIVFWGDAADPTGITNIKGVLSISGTSHFVEQGVTLGVVVQEDKRPKILLNLESSRAEGADWKPAILGVAETL